MHYDEFYEQLVWLYLRLNGFFVTGLVVHSPEKGMHKTEFDAIAVRHRYHDQEARGVPTSNFFAVDGSLTDFLICEVKSSEQNFNKPQLTEECVADALKWAGLLDNEGLANVTPTLLRLMTDGTSAEMQKGIVWHDIRFRPLLAFPAVKVVSGDRWCLLHDEVMGYVDRCLDPRERPASCSRTYSLETWGAGFEPIVAWFKKRKKSEPPTLEQLWRDTTADPSVKLR